MLTRSQLRILIPVAWVLSLSACSGSPVCSTGSLQGPNLNAPADFSIVGSLLPELSWSYPDGTCHPEGYRIDLSPDRDFADTSLSGGTGNPSTNWFPGSNLQPGSEYFWKVAAINGITLGPASSYRRFFTGPLCNPAALAAPTLVWPADGETVNTIMPGLEWANGNAGCIPQGYGIHLSSDPTFADTTYNGGTGNPDTLWFPGDNLVDCTTYYWLVFSGIDTTFGPDSATRSFYTNASGTCAGTATPTPTAALPTFTSTPTAALPTFTPTTASGSFFQPDVQPKQIYYRGTGCGPMENKVKVLVSDPARVAGVWLFVRLRNKDGDGNTNWSEALVMAPLGSGWYAYQLSSSMIPDYTSYENAYVQYQFVAYGANFQKIATSDVYWDVNLTACHTGGQTTSK